MVLKYDITIALADITLLLFETNLSKKILEATNTFADMRFFPPIVSSHIGSAHFLRVW